MTNFQYPASAELPSTDALERARVALSFLSPNCPRAEWVYIGMGVHDELGEDGWPIFDAWSSQGDSYKHATARDVWKSFKQGGGKGFGYVVDLAKREGFDAKVKGYTKPTPEQVAEREAKHAERQKVHAAEEAIEEAEAAVRANKRWGEGKDATDDYPYLKKKGVKAHGLRVGSWWKWDPVTDSQIELQNTLLLPVKDVHGKIWSLQGITENGDKYLLSGGAKKGKFLALGKPRPNAEGNLVYGFAEGYATAASAHELTGIAVLCCFDVGNMVRLVREVREKKPAAELIIFADNDTKTEAKRRGNPGMKAAFRIGMEYDAAVVFAPGGGDFNDLVQEHGAEAAQAAFAARLVPTAAYAPSTPPAAHLHVDAAAGQTDAAPATLVPDLEEYPCWRVFDEPVFHEGRRFYGVNFFGLKAAKTKDGEPKPFSVYVCGPLHVEAQTHAFDELNSFGRLLRWRTSAGKWQKWAMPAELLAGDAKELRARLMSHGLEINPDAHHDLKRYLSGEAMRLKSVHCVLQTGWTSDAHEAFVLPGEVLGPRASQAVLQVEHPEEDPYERHGTAAGWRERIAAMAPGNSALTLGISIALAGPLLDVVRAEPGGVHLWGDSSTGKSTVLEAASSVWGHHKRFSRSWRTTANGLEGAASHRTDTLLALDEIGQCDPAHLSDIVYMLGNGVGKQRANISGGARAVKTFRVAVLSTGEVSVAAALAKNGSTPRAGQGVRLIDVCVVGRTHGVWEALHQHPNGAAFSEALKSSVVEHYGHAGPEFVERVATVDRAVLRERFEKMKEALASAAVGTQERRVASRLAVYALAGELATEFGITGWPSGWATEAVTAEFLRYRSDRGSKGHGNAEPHQILQAVVDFAQKHGDSRFESAIGGGSDRPVNNRAGWRKGADGHVKYLFTSAGLKEATSGFDLARVLAVLTEFEALEVQESRLKEGKKSSTVRINGETQTVYCVNYAALLSALTPVAA